VDSASSSAEVSLGLFRAAAESRVCRAWSQGPRPAAHSCGDMISAQAAHRTVSSTKRAAAALDRARRGDHEQIAFNAPIAVKFGARRREQGNGHEPERGLLLEALFGLLRFDRRTQRQARPRFWIKAAAVHGH